MGKHMGKKSLVFNFTEQQLSRIVEMAWEDRTPFEAIKEQFALDESQTILIMRTVMKKSSFKMWRIRVAGRITKHMHLRGFKSSKAYAPAQYKPRV